jgi:hypothetical protein
MSHDEYLDDSTLTRDLRDSLADLPVPGRPSLVAITSRGRVHRRRRRLAGLGVTSTAACLALALGLIGVFGTAPSRSTGTIQTADFTLTSYTNGTVAVNLRQMFGPAALQQALRRNGIPALVRSNTYCSSNPAVPSPVGLGVLSIPPPPGLPPGSRHRSAPPAGSRHEAVPPGGEQGIIEGGNWPVKPSQLAPSIADAIQMVINPTAMPAGTELFIGYFNLGHTAFLNLIHAGSHTCRKALEPPGVPQPPPTS